MYGIIEEFNYKPDKPATNFTATQKGVCKDWMNCCGVALLTNLVYMEQRIEAEYSAIDFAMMFWEKFTSAYQSKYKLNISEIWENLWSNKLQDNREVDNYALQINQMINYYNPCIGPSTTDTDADCNSGKTITKLSEEEHSFSHLCKIPWKDEWKVLVELINDKNVMMTTIRNEIISILIEVKAVIKTENWFGPDAMLFAKNGGEGCDGRTSSKGSQRDK